VEGDADRQTGSARERNSRLSSMTCFSRSITPLTHIAVRAMSFTDRGPTLVLAGEGFVKLLEIADELLTDHGFGIEIYPSDSAERREIVDSFGLGLHLASLVVTGHQLDLRKPPKATTRLLERPRQKKGRPF
jgi:hypothetical protein